MAVSQSSVLPTVRVAAAGDTSTEATGCMVLPPVTVTEALPLTAPAVAVTPVA